MITGTFPAVTEHTKLKDMPDVAGTNTDHDTRYILHQGLDAALPAPGIAGRHYWATDTLILYRDNGAAWVETVRGEAATRLAQLLERAHTSLTGVTPDQHHPQAHAPSHQDGGLDEINTALDPRAYPMLAGTLAARPAAGIAGRFYWTTDEGILYRDDGAAWVKVAVSDYPDLDDIPASFPPAAHDLAGAEHNADTFANLNTKVSDATLLRQGDTLTANLGANPGVTVDGVDVSAHAANPAAHHAKTGDDEVKGLIASGLDANKPAAGADGRMYYATDTDKLYRDNGTSWDVVAVMALANLATRAHSDLTGIGTSDHHAKYTDAEAKAAAVDDTAYGAAWDGVTDVAPSKNAVYDEMQQKLENVVEDTTPQAGGDFDFNNKRAYNVKVLDFKAPTELTIATGAITVSQTFHTVDTEADAASDDLDTINGGSDGRLIVLKPANDARTVVVKHNTGNIWLQGKADISLDDISDGLMLVYSAADSKWFDIAAGGGGGGGSSTWVGLTDTPGSITANQFVRGNAGGTALEFIDHEGAADPHTGYVLESLFDANTILKADSDNTPLALAVAASCLVGRKATGGIAALTTTEVETLLTGKASTTKATQTVYVDKAATGAGDGTSWTDAFTTIQAAWDSLPTIIAHDITIKVRKGATPYREQVELSAKYVIASVTIEGEYYWQGDCEANTTAGDIVDTGAFGDVAVGDKVFILDLNGANGRAQDYELCTVDDVSGAPDRIGTDGSKTATTGWKYTIVRTEISGSDDGTDAGTARRVMSRSLLKLKVEVDAHSDRYR